MKRALFPWVAVFAAGCSLVVDGSDYVAPDRPGFDGGGQTDGGIVPGPDAGDDADTDGGTTDGAIGSDGSTGGNPLEDLLLLHNAYWEIHCGCGYTASFGCPPHNPDEVVACIGALYSETDPTLGPSLDCELPIWSDAITCSDEALCDADALFACDLAKANALAACPLPTDAVLLGVQDCLLGDSTDCYDAVIEAANYPFVVTGVTTRRGDRLASSCQTGSLPVPEMIFQWTPPWDGYFWIETFENSFDTVLAVYDGCAGSGVEVACNDDCLDTSVCPESSSRSLLSVAATAGVPLYIAVEGFYDALEHGRFALAITPF